MGDVRTLDVRAGCVIADGCFPLPSRYVSAPARVHLRIEVRELEAGGLN